MGKERDHAACAGKRGLGTGMGGKGMNEVALSGTLGDRALSWLGVDSFRLPHPGSAPWKAGQGKALWKVWEVQKISNTSRKGRGFANGLGGAG